MRRRTQWVDFQLDTTVGVGNYVAYDLLATYAALPGASTAGATVGRVHGRTWVTSSVTVGDGITTALIVDQNTETVAGPGAALAVAHGLSPTFNTELNWMEYRQWNAHPQYDFHGGTSANLEHDIRAKRRLAQLGDTLLYIFENRDASATVSIAIHFRTLLIMP